MAIKADNTKRSRLSMVEAEKITKNLLDIDVIEQCKSFLP